MIHRLSKTVFESDNNLFCLLTMNHHPVHTNEHYAKDAKHGKILVAGTYVLSLVVGLSVQDMSFGCVAALSYRHVKHLAPVFVGDTIYARSEILSEKKGVRCIFTVGYTQNEDVISFTRYILI